MPAPMTHTLVDMEVSSATTHNNSVNGPINYLIGREIGTDDAIEIEDSMRIEPGTMGDRFWGVPGGSTGQRPTGATGRVRFNTTLENLDIHDGTDWTNPLTIEAVTAANLLANGDVGTGSDQVAAGDHIHPTNAFLSEYRAIDEQIERGVPITIRTFTATVQAADRWLVLVGARRTTANSVGFAVQVNGTAILNPIFTAANNAAMLANYNPPDGQVTVTFVLNRGIGPPAAEQVAGDYFAFIVPWP